MSIPARLFIMMGDSVLVEEYKPGKAVSDGKPVPHSVVTVQACSDMWDQSMWFTKDQLAEFIRLLQLRLDRMDEPVDEPVKRFDGAEFGFLSNFYPSPIEVDGLMYPTVEHAFQAHKTNLPLEREQIRLAPTPGIAKTIGRRALLRSDWESRKQHYMRVFVAKKFAIGTELAARLLSTGDRELIEGNNWHDRFWGVDQTGRGENNLGKILMERRADLRRLE